jgi:hypothetical protein
VTKKKEKKKKPKCQVGKNSGQEQPNSMLSSQQCTSTEGISSKALSSVCKRHVMPLQQQVQALKKMPYGAHQCLIWLSYIIPEKGRGV